MLQQIEHQIKTWLAKDAKRPLIIGIQAIQGCGKTYLCSYLTQSLPCRVVAISLDDFYIPYHEQLKLGSNPLLKYRGLPGTHSVDLADQVLTLLRNKKPVLIPRFDKSLHNGRGDRIPEENWTRVENVDVVLLEGWCLGFISKDKITIDFPMDFPCTLQDLQQVDKNLKEYELKIYPHMDYFVQIKPLDLGYVLKWRWNQELSMKERLGPSVGLSEAQVVDFVSRFMPLYHIYLPELNNGFFKDQAKNFTIYIDFNRKVIN